MRKFTLISIAALLVASNLFANAADKSQKRHPATRISLQENRNAAGIQALPGQSAARSMKNALRMTKFGVPATAANGVRQSALRTSAKNAQKAPRRNDVESRGVIDQPEGKLYANEIVSFNGIAYSWFYGIYNTDTDAGVANVVEGTDGNIYIQGLTPSLYDDELYWIKAERGEGDTIIVKKQPAGIYEYSDGSVEVDYIARLEQYTYYDEEDDANYIDYRVAEDSDIKFIYKDGELTATSDIQGSADDLPAYGFGIVYAIEDEDGFEDGDAEWDYSLYWNYASQINHETINELPDGAEVEQLVLKYKNVDDTYSYLIPAAFVGNEFYFQPYEDTEGWIKGSIEGDKVVVKSGQYLGIDGYYGGHTWAHTATVEQRYDEDYEEYYDYGTINDQLVFDYDAEAKSLKASEGAIYIDGAKDRIYYADYYNLPELYRFVEVAATPADPVITNFWDYDEYYESAELDFRIPTADVDGNFISPEKLSYSAYVDDEVFEFDGDEYETFEGIYDELPYGFGDGYWIGSTYLCFFLQPAKNVGLQSIYRGADEEHRSNIVFYNIEDGEIYTVSGIQNAVGGESKAVSREAYYDAAGRQVTANAQGFVIKTVTFADGSKKSYKVIRK